MNSASSIRLAAHRKGFGQFINGRFGEPGALFDVFNPATGEVLGDINLTGLLAPGDRDDNTDVLNGIAYDAAGDRLFVTGKNWPKLFEIRLKPE